MNRKKRSLKPRNRESVENRQLDADADSGRSLTPRGDFSINPNVTNVRLDKLRCYKNGKTVIRIWNMLDPENPGESLLNGRLSAVDLAGLGGMSISEPALCVQYAGIHKDSGTFLGNDTPEQCSYIIARSKNSSYEGIKFWDLPYPKLYVMAKKARDSGEFGHGGAWNPKWNALMSGQMPALGSFKQRYFVVCSVYENGPNIDLVRERVEYRKDGKDISEDYKRDGIPLGDSPTDPVMVLQLPVSAGRRLLQMSCMEKEDYSGNTAIDPSCMFKYGDPCGKFDAKTQTVKGGLFFTLYNPEKVTIDKHTSFQGVTNPQVVEYECAVSNKYTGPNGVLSASLSSEQVDNIFNKHLFLWRDSDADPKDSYLLHEPSIEERCEKLVRAFKQVPKLLEFCWMSQPEYLQFDSVQAVLKNRVVSIGSVAKPGAEDDAPFDTDDAPASKAKKEKKKSVDELIDEFDDELDEDGDDDELNEDKVEESDDDDDEFEDEDEESNDDDDDDDDDEFEDEDEESDDEESEDFDDTEIVDEIKDEFEDDGDNDDDAGGDDADGDEGESNDFDAFDDEAEVSNEVNEQLNQSLSKAKGIARSRKRTSQKPTTKAASTKPTTKAASTKPTTKAASTKKKSTTQK